MNNTGAIWYLILTRIKGSIRNAFRKPFSIIFTLILTSLTIFGLYRSLKSGSPIKDTFLMDRLYLNLIAGGLLYLAYSLFFVSKSSALVYENDALFLFSGPFTQRQTYLYLIINTLQGSVALGLGFVIYLIIFFAESVAGPVHMLGLFLSMGLHFTLIIMIFNYQYVQNAIKEDVRKMSKWPIIIVGLVMLVMFLMIWDYQFSLESLQQVTHHPMFKMIPFIGTFGWVANAFVLGDSSVIIILLILIGLIGLTTFLMLRTKGNFIEKALQDAEYASAITRQVKQGKQIDMTDVDKLKKRNVQASFFEGAFSLLSKQILVLRKTRKFIPFGILLFGAIYGVVALLAQDILLFKMLIVFSIIFGSDVTSFLQDELEKPYIYLIPDTELKKLISTLVVPFIRVSLVQIIYFFILVFLGDPVLDALVFIFYTLSAFIMIMVFNVMMLNLFRGKTNFILQSYINIFMTILSFVPALGLGALLFFLMDVTDFSSILLGASVLNLLLSFILLNTSKSILKGNNLIG